jgi:hypothetical protein
MRVHLTVKAIKALKPAGPGMRYEVAGAAISPWVVNDLRRTARSVMSRADLRPDICERALGQAIPGVWGAFDRYT